jgi:hypothetical protein
MTWRLAHRSLSLPRTLERITKNATAPWMTIDPRGGPFVSTAILDTGVFGDRNRS